MGRVRLASQMGKLRYRERVIGGGDQNPPDNEEPLHHVGFSPFSKWADRKIGIEGGGVQVCYRFMSPPPTNAGGHRRAPSLQTVREHRVSLTLDYMSPTRGGFSSASQMLSGFHHRVLAYLSLKYSLAISFLYTVINGIVFLNIHFPIVCCWLVGKLLNFCKVTTLPESWMKPSFHLGICLWIYWTFCVHIPRCLKIKMILNFLF